MKRICLLFFCWGILSASQAQISGYRGKHFLLKSDLTAWVFPNNGGGNITLEMVPFRNVSLSIGFQKYRRDFGKFTIHRRFSEKEFSHLSVSNQHLFLEGRFYQNPGMPAPLGFFLYGRVGAGVAEFTGAIPLPRINDITGQEEMYEQSFYLKNLPGGHWEYGLGYQWIWFDRLSLDATFGVVSGIYSSAAREVGYLGLVETLVGPNLSSFNWNKKRSNNGGSRFTAHLAVGCLLF